MNFRAVFLGIFWRFLLRRVSTERNPTNRITYACFYGNFAKFGDLLFPRQIACFIDKPRILDITATDLAVESPLDASFFTPPAEAIEIGLCSGQMTHPKATFSPRPVMS